MPPSGGETDHRAAFTVRAAHPKLDPRLAYLAGLPDAALHRLVNSERAMAVTPPPAAPDDAGAALSYAPLTAGLLLPGDPDGRSPVAGLPDRLGEPVFSVFITGDCSARDLADQGVVPRCRSGDVHTAFVPRSRLRSLEAMRSVSFIEKARGWSLDLGSAVPHAGMSQLHAAVPPIDGRNVIIGVVDNFIDIYHPAFSDDAGETRLLHIWDQTLLPADGEASPPIAPELPDFIPIIGQSYGVDYSATQIAEELAAFNPPAVPPYGIVRHAPPDPIAMPAAKSMRHHGTLVAGCAAGNGGGGSQPGAAPGSAIIFVSPLDYDNGLKRSVDNTGVLDGCAYIFARAQQLGLPCVVNISMGDNLGPHDGTTPGERFLDNLLDVSGRVITLSAGNGTGRGEHAEGSVVQGGTTTLVLNYVMAGGRPPRGSDAIDIWYGGDDRFDVTVTVPTSPPTVIGPVSPGTSTSEVPVAGVGVQITSLLHDPGNGENTICILIIVPAGEAVPTGGWTIALTGTAVTDGAFHAWVDRNNRGQVSWAQPADHRLTLGAPATARRPITVAAHSNITAGSPTIYSFSGRGPTRDGRIKPEITAAGLGVTGPVPGNPRTNLPQPPGHASGTGTSFSAPLVAGAAALLFQCRGAGAHCADIKQRLIAAAGTNGVVLPDDGFGFGYLSMDGACTALPPSVDVWIRKTLADTGAGPWADETLHASPDIEILDLNGDPTDAPVPAAGGGVTRIVRVTVRNRGGQTARNIDVFVHWAGPFTDIASPMAWMADGFRTANPVGPPGEAPFARLSNHFVLAELPAGEAATVEFGWSPPAFAGDGAGSDRFRLLARLEHELDASGMAPGAGLPGSNNLAQRDVRFALIG
ncbi:S8 family serine peptidase [Roseomonas terrae]|uniref:S8 family serine peptidase n=1 Tax=Neoroseomonas terrae TaxID=424799 RepID=A0ABS5EAR9_9PROT|nr:S8 family serine peptidase [Neoroseomonas terrae]MBR0648116.1 S8 family serine peptidase [Neoroseomonas terrae]